MQKCTMITSTPARSTIFAHFIIQECMTKKGLAIFVQALSFAWTKTLLNKETALAVLSGLCQSIHFDVIYSILSQKFIIIFVTWKAKSGTNVRLNI